jgi:hypothetical protein
LNELGLKGLKPIKTHAFDFARQNPSKHMFFTNVNQKTNKNTSIFVFQFEMWLNFQESKENTFCCSG